ncbi:LBF_0142 family lipoprotein [Leptospira sarikeiensis]|uniref:Lipoprotein n=1 Tax=Leptospira sarikeiensis TaxID=2484943 RepID=A0A4R9K406_9LEPT|nr:hypothetical protein [Leptospira sarikeiensis]TGL60816.1 hypothetical protein EHQ64_13465 [Leptospira sarikeiensis]
MKRQFLFLKMELFAIPLCLVIWNCSLSDLRDPSFPIQEYNQRKAKALVSEINIPKDLKVAIRGKDIWNSDFIRLFTPVSENEQYYRAWLDLNTGDLDLEFMGKDRKTFRKIGNTYFEKTDDGKEIQTSGLTSIYLGSFALYIRLPYIISKFPILSYIGSQKLDQQEFDLIFASEEVIQPSVNSNQYVFYIEKKEKRIKYIQFTYREVSKSYIGFLEYVGETEVNGVSMPREIYIRDSLGSKDFVHKIEISKLARE